MVLVTVVMACCAKARSAILRLFSAIRMFRRVMSRPTPCRSCWEKLMPMVDCTEGSKRLNGEVEDERVLSQKTLSVVPVEKPCENAVLKLLWWTPSAAIPLVPVPEPEVRGLFTAIRALVIEMLCVR